MSTFAKLQILSGCHAGALQKLTTDEVAIGSSLNAGIVLTDLSIAPIHARLVCSRFSVELKAEEASIVLGSRVLEPGEVVKFAYPIRFQLGDVEAECVSDHDGFGIPRLSNRAAIAVPIGVLLVLGTSAAINPLFLKEGSNFSSSYAAKGGLAPASTETANHPTIARPEALQAAVQALREHLASAGIRTIEVSIEDNAVRAKGVVTQDGERAWRAIQVWFDGSLGQEIMLQPEVAVSVTKAQNAPIGIQAIWAGKRPYLIDDHGDKYFEGSLLKDRWVVQKIENNRVVLRRNGEILDLDL